jgi:hypothetical protein
MSDIKRDYDIAATAAYNAQLHYDCDFFAHETIYESKKKELRRARQMQSRAMSLRDQAQTDSWTNIIGILEDKLAEVLAIMNELQDCLNQAVMGLQMLRAEIASRAGIPTADIKIVNEKTGKFSIYFGGVRLPDGPGHAHYVYDESCELSYRREPTRQKPAPAWRR